MECATNCAEDAAVMFQLQHEDKDSQWATPQNKNPLEKTTVAHGVGAKGGCLRAACFCPYNVTCLQSSKFASRVNFRRHQPLVNRVHTVQPFQEVVSLWNQGCDTICGDSTVAWQLLRTYVTGMPIQPGHQAGIPLKYCGFCTCRCGRREGGGCR